MTDFADFGPRRRVDGGLRARSTRGTIGSSWWARRFVEVLESFALGTRLTRGRSYARSGQVLALTIEPGVVTASVQGSRPKPYAVRIGLAAFGEPVWARVEKLLAAQALYNARMLAGDLPPELEEVFAGAGAALFPASVDELAMRCSCPDFAVPCKHLAATFYLLAEALDADPFQLLRWRGRSREQLLSRLRAAAPGATATATGSATRSAAGSVAPGVRPGTAPGPAGPPERVAGSAAGAGAALGDLAEVGLADAVGRFWHPPVPLPRRPASVPAGADLLLRQLGSPGRVLGGPGLTERLRRAYERFAVERDGPEGPPVR
ncbi:SWIM zinc finger family protein [Plantactinospora sp. GCM10030261]|uniref:SWIM zinc finger family protein n=1 Tax=Plantactinospora sp. GCM10030261 TaxID=3273420 RepID=UPI0036173D18